ncbi:MAG: hypothetical protein LC772_05110 [Chloroflexi bacterium]|nr:hypothetical protein [Chloroflexota bacterium]
MSTPDVHIIGIALFKPIQFRERLYDGVGCLRPEKRDGVCASLAACDHCARRSWHSTPGRVRAGRHIGAHLALDRRLVRRGVLQGFPVDRRARSFLSEPQCAIRLLEVGRQLDVGRTSVGHSPLQGKELKLSHEEHLEGKITGIYPRIPHLTGNLRQVGFQRARLEVHPSRHVRLNKRGRPGSSG